MADSKITQLNANTTPVLADILPIVDDPAGSPETQKIALGSLFPRARVYDTTSQSIPNVTDTVLTFNSERWDSESIHSTVTNTGRLTVPRNGLYMISGDVSFTANATGTRIIYIRLDGATFISRLSVDSIGAAITTRLNISTMYYLTATQYVELLVYQNSGGALAISYSANASPEFSIAMIGPGA